MLTGLASLDIHNVSVKAADGSKGEPWRLHQFHNISSSTRKDAVGNTILGATTVKPGASNDLPRFASLHFDSLIALFVVRLSIPKPHELRVISSCFGVSGVSLA